MSNDSLDDFGSQPTMPQGVLYESGLPPVMAHQVASTAGPDVNTAVMPQDAFDDSGLQPTMPPRGVLDEYGSRPLIAHQLASTVGAEVNTAVRRQDALDESGSQPTMPEGALDVEDGGCIGISISRRLSIVPHWQSHPKPPPERKGSKSHTTNTQPSKSTLNPWATPDNPWACRPSPLDQI